VKRLAITLALILTTATAVSVAPAQAGGYVDPFGWKKCNTKLDANLTITKAKSMRCRGARRVMGRYDGQIKRKFKTSGFTCKLIKGRPISGVWRCKNGERAFRFAFGD
jgi:hypothetical protein